MERNPINVFNERLSQAGEVLSLAIRSKLAKQRYNKLNKIDLRKYKGRPEKKEQIKRLKNELMQRICWFLTQSIIVMSQPMKYI